LVRSCTETPRSLVSAGSPPLLPVTFRPHHCNYSECHQEPSTMWDWLIGTWFLGLIAIAGTAYMIGGYKPWPRVATGLWRIAGIWFAVGTVYFVYANHELRKPSLVSRWFPGFWSPSPVPRWLMLVRHYAPQPVHNIELVFMDKDKRRAAAGNKSMTPEQTAAMTATFHLTELDPTENFWATQFP
jgi:hypothetical protein